MAGKVPAKLVPEEMAFRVRGFQFLSIGTVANDDFGAGQAQLEKRFNVLFDSYSPEIHPDRTVEIVFDRVIGHKYVGLYATRPDDDAFEASWV
ncbi:MAG: hypothetical protein P8X98_14750 [Woeseiaceae bacterium]